MKKEITILSKSHEHVKLAFIILFSQALMLKKELQERIYEESCNEEAVVFNNQKIKKFGFLCLKYASKTSKKIRLL